MCRACTRRMKSSNGQYCFVLKDSNANPKNNQISSVKAVTPRHFSRVSLGPTVTSRNTKRCFTEQKRMIENPNEKMIPAAHRWT